VSHRARQISSVASAVACVAAIGPVAAAQASDATIRSTIKTAVPKIEKSQAKLSSQSASSASGTKGKSDIVKGLRLIIGSNTTLAKELQQSAHHAPVSKAKVKAATAADMKGNRDLNAGSKLLKLG
jgi:hypothetical protein